jgi:hypothetical protein
MLSLRRWLLAALLTVLVLGCEKKPQPVGVEETPEEHMARKFQMVKNRPEGPQLHP